MQEPFWSRAPRSSSVLLAALIAAVMTTRCGGDGNQDLATEESRVIEAAGEATEAERAAIREISAGWLQATRDRQADRVAAYFAPDAVVFQSGRTPVVGRESIRADIERDWAVNPDFTIEWQSSFLSVAGSGEMAWERGTWTFDPDGPRSSPPNQGAFLTVYEKVDGEWKVAADVGLPTGDARVESGRRAGS